MSAACWLRERLFAIEPDFEQIEPALDFAMRHRDRGISGVAFGLKWGLEAGSLMRLDQSDDHIDRHGYKHRIENERDHTVRDAELPHQCRFDLHI